MLQFLERETNLLRDFSVVFAKNAGERYCLYLREDVADTMEKTVALREFGELCKEIHNKGNYKNVENNVFSSSRCLKT